MSARLVMADEPGAQIDLEFRGQSYRAMMDPMWLGPEQLMKLLHHPPLVWQLLDERDRARVMTSDPFGRHTVSLLEAYLDRVGLGLDGLVRLVHALEHLDLLEVDLLRMGLDVREWLDPEGSLSSRRVSLLVKDFQERPETCIGADLFGVKPLPKEAFLLAQYVGGPEKGQPHQFLKSPDKIREELEAARLDREKRSRIARRGF